jgi:3-methyladenine DNA glycosylase AlkD
MGAAVTARTIHREMLALGTPARRRGAERFFKTGPGEYGEGDRFIGLTVPALRGLAKKYYALPMTEIDRLLASPWHEARLLALLILVRQYQKGDARTRQAIYRLYLRRTRRINNWDLVDCSAEHIIGPHWREADATLLTRLARSPLLWERRIAMLATFHDIKQRRFREPLRVARLLMNDDEDLIHKAVGWMLREIGKRDLDAEKRFLDRYATRLPRTALRYAIERFPPAVRARYLAR